MKTVGLTGGAYHRLPVRRTRWSREVVRDDRAHRCYARCVAGLFYHDVLVALADAEVRFVIVGGVAVNLQGVPRFTSDLDVAAYNLLRISKLVPA